VGGGAQRALEGDALGPSNGPAESLVYGNSMALVDMPAVRTRAFPSGGSGPRTAGAPPRPRRSGSRDSALFGPARGVHAALAFPTVNRFFDGAFVWVRRALNRQSRRVPARAGGRLVQGNPLRGRAGEQVVCRRPPLSSPYQMCTKFTAIPRASPTPQVAGPRPVGGRQRGAHVRRGDGASGLHHARLPAAAEPRPARRARPTAGTAKATRPPSPSPVLIFHG
jgi:hypothetical protein